MSAILYKISSEARGHLQAFDGKGGLMKFEVRPPATSLAQYFSYEPWSARLNQPFAKSCYIVCDKSLAKTLQLSYKGRVYLNGRRLKNQSPFKSISDLVGYIKSPRFRF